jgi:asparagine synthase (glutamine-hydrolysing)
LTYGYPRIPIYNKIFEVEPGHYIDEKGVQHKINFRFRERDLMKVIQGQYITTDRPIGITLSGGVDSSFLVHAVSQITDKIETFTIGFSEQDQDIIAAREVAKHYNTNHHEIIIDENEIRNSLKEAIDILGFPMDLGSVAHTNILAKEIAKTDIKVILIGEGADEVFAGYKRYKEMLKHKLDFMKHYHKRIRKNEQSENKELLGDYAYTVLPRSNGWKADDKNKVLWYDIKNELQYYHLKRIDHIISHYGIEARVPYLDRNIIMQSLKMKYSDKVRHDKDKIWFRKYCIEKGLPEAFAMRPKLPLKKEGLNTSDHLKEIVGGFINEKNIDVGLGNDLDNDLD